MTDRPSRVVAEGPRVTHVGAGDCVAAVQRPDHEPAGHGEATSVTSIAALIEPSIPGLRQPDFELDLGIGGGPRNAGDAAEGRNGDGRAVRRSEPAGRDGRYQRDGRVVRELETRKAAASLRGGCRR